MRAVISVSGYVIEIGDCYFPAPALKGFHFTHYYMYIYYIYTYSLLLALYSQRTAMFAKYLHCLFPLCFPSVTC